MTGRVVPIARAGRRSGGEAARAAARVRHPTARTRQPDRSAMLDRLAARARTRGAQWPRVAAAVLLLRGVAGDDRAGFAARTGVPPAVLDRLERGLVPPSEVPARLRAVAGLVDWAWVDDPRAAGAAGGGGPPIGRGRPAGP
jgi:hypothetical protein